MKTRRHAATMMLGITAGLGFAPPLLAEQPMINFETVLEGEEFDSGRAIALDAAGNAFVLGYTVEQGDHDILVVKVDTEGAIEWTADIGGSSFDIGTDLAVDAAGDVLVVGRSQSADFPTMNALQPGKNGPSDGILLRLDSSDGSIVQSSYFGGSRGEQISGIAIDAEGAIYLTGRTDSIDFPLMNPIQDALVLIHCFCDDVFVAKLSPAADEILFSTYLGGSFRDQGHAIALGDDGDVYVAGLTRSSEDFPIVGGAQETFGGAISDLFVARLDIDEPAIVYSSYLGGSGTEIAGGLVVDADGRAIVGGSTVSPDFPTTAGAYQPAYAGGIDACPAGFGFDRNCYDAFVVGFAADGGSFDFGTFLGGDSDDECRDLTLDADGRIHLAGYTFSADFPPDGIDTSGELFAATFTPDANDLVHRFSFDSMSANAGHGIAIASNGDTLLTGAVHVPSDLYVVRFSPQDGASDYDLNTDGAVDVQDLTMLLGAWGPCPIGEPCDADFDDSGTVDVVDLILLLAAWGS